MVANLGVVSCCTGRNYMVRTKLVQRMKGGRHVRINESDVEHTPPEEILRKTYLSSRVVIWFTHRPTTRAGKMV